MSSLGGGLGQGHGPGANIKYRLRTEHFREERRVLV